MASPTADKVVVLSPAAALGEDLVIDLTGPTDPSGWTLAVYAGHTPNGPSETLAGMTAVALGDDDNTIRVTLPAAATAVLTVLPPPDLNRLYVEVWRADPGNKILLRRLALPYFDPVRDPN